MGVELSRDAIAKAERLARAQQTPITVDWRYADATQFAEPSNYDLTMLVYLQLPAPQRRLRSAPPGSHCDRAVCCWSSPTTVTTWPPEWAVPRTPAVLYTRDDVLTDLTDVGAQDHGPSSAPGIPLGVYAGHPSWPDSKRTHHD